MIRTLFIFVYDDLRWNGIYLQESFRNRKAKLRDVSSYFIRFMYFYLCIFFYVVVLVIHLLHTICFRKSVISPLCKNSIRGEACSYLQKSCCAKLESFQFLSYLSVEYAEYLVQKGEQQEKEARGIDCTEWRCRWQSLYVIWH